MLDRRAFGPKAGEEAVEEGPEQFVEQIGEAGVAP
jgi:hypothetical protein